MANVGYPAIRLPELESVRRLREARAEPSCPNCGGRMVCTECGETEAGVKGMKWGSGPYSKGSHHKGYVRDPRGKNKWTGNVEWIPRPPTKAERDARRREKRF